MITTKVRVVTQLLRTPAVAAVAFAAFVGTQPAHASGDQDFALVNNTGYAVTELYISPTSTDDWEEDVLGRDVFENGERTTIDFEHSEDACLWDMKAVFEDGVSVVWHGLDLCDISVVSLRYNADTDETSATVE